MHSQTTLGMLMRCLSNIDEEVLEAACDALFCLLNRSPPARLLFLRRRGIAELNECLCDYNTGIKTTTLQVICVLASEGEAARHDMRQEDVLLGVLRCVQAFPADDVTLPVLDAALEAVSHIVSGCRENQEYIRVKGGLEPLYMALHYCVRHLPGAAEDENASLQSTAAAAGGGGAPNGHHGHAPTGVPNGGGHAGSARPRPASAAGTQPCAYECLLPEVHNHYYTSAGN